MPVIDQQLVNDYNRATHIGRGRDMNAELRSEAESVLNSLSDRNHTLDTEEQKTEARRLVEDYLQSQADFMRWDARASINNPSWIVTGRGGRKVEKANAANERHMDEYSKRVDQLQKQRKRIVDVLYAMRPQAIKDDQAIASDLKGIAEQVGYILADIQAGNTALAADTRKWASPKAHRLIDRSLSADRQRTIEYIKELDGLKAVQEAGGIVKVLGPRSKAGSLVRSILEEPASESASGSGVPPILGQADNAAAADDWLREHGVSERQISGVEHDGGVGLLTLKESTKDSFLGRVYARGDGDSRIVYRLGDGREVWWDAESKNIYQVVPGDDVTYYPTPEADSTEAQRLFKEVEPVASMEVSSDEWEETDSYFNNVSRLTIELEKVTDGKGPYEDFQNDLLSSFARDRKKAIAYARDALGINESAETPAIQTEAAEEITSGLEANTRLQKRLSGGEEVTASEVKQVFKFIADNPESVKSELNKLTKKQLMGRISGHVWSDAKKADLVDQAYREMISSFAFISSNSDVVTFSGYRLEDRIKQTGDLVDSLTDEQVREYANRRRAAIEEHLSERRELANRLKNPQTLEDFRELIKAKGMDALTR